LNAAKLAKIKALANDPRGDPATRAIAQAALKRYAAEPPRPTPQQNANLHNQQHPGMRTSAEYDRYRFMDLGSWKTTANGNPTHLIVHKGKSYRIVLFKHKKRPTHGWMRIDIIADIDPVFSNSFATQSEAHADAWKSLMAI
jgi:hypothetical protein